MSQWTMKQLEEMNDIDFAIAILEERRKTTSNIYSPLNKKINSAKHTLALLK